MSHYMQPLAVATLLLCLCGCNTDFGKPYVEDGPLPLTGADLKLVRYRQSSHQGALGRVERTRWSDGGTPVDPADFIVPLLKIIPEHIHEKLLETTPTHNSMENRTFDRLDYGAWATVVSLDPDVLIISIRKRTKENAFQGLFDEFSSYEEVRFERLEQYTELIDCDGVSLCFHAGTLLPYSDEMYLVSTEPNIANGKLVFDDDGQVVIGTGRFAFRLIKSKTDTDIIVTRP